MHKDVYTKREKAVVSEMIALYCRRQHGKKNGLCPHSRSSCLRRFALREVQKNYTTGLPGQSCTKTIWKAT